MSSNSVEHSRGATRWSMAQSLTLYYIVSFFILLAIASAFLYWTLARSVDQDNRDRLMHKVEVMTALVQEQPFDLAGIEQEVREEAEISAQSQSPFFLRVLDSNNRLVTETPGMEPILPTAVFPQLTMPETREQPWRSGDSHFLLASSLTAASASRWHIQAALNISAGAQLLGKYRRDIALVLVAGLLIAAPIGAWIVRRGLRPIEHIARATESIDARQLHQRIDAGQWPTELVTLAAAFDRMLDRLQDSFERLSQFSADLAHELRTPINNLIGETQVALSHERTAAEYLRVLQSALEEYGRLARMCDSMLFLAQADQSRSALSLVLLDLRAEMQTVVDFYQALADEQGVELICEGEGKLRADPSLLRRAISNLLSNGLKYTSRGGRITLGIASTSDALILSVVDSGIGIASQHLAKLGDRFYRVDPARADSASGAGLGLAIVKSIMALHGGRLSIESAVGKGTTASLIFVIDH